VSRLLGIDHGSRRIGVAVADRETRLAFERPALAARSLAADAAAVSDLARSEGADLVVIGLPLAPDGGEGDQARLARRFGDALVERGVAVAYADERFSSDEARRQLAEAGRQPERRTGEVDSAAARLVLQQFLDQQES
jgi:putative Holliday junction resolvase